MFLAAVLVTVSLVSVSTQTFPCKPPSFTARSLDVINFKIENIYNDAGRDIILREDLNSSRWRLSDNKNLTEYIYNTTNCERSDFSISEADGGYKLKHSLDLPNDTGSYYAWSGSSDDVTLEVLVDNHCIPISTRIIYDKDLVASIFVTNVVTDNPDLSQIDARLRQVQNASFCPHDGWY
ncbi:hypothetical protein ElyMa_004697100 [Elysia marginata]|uniref:Lipocalin/cytosolic fatty-acid binding domain-containing protein n=1 Tax=Elysia marginata TaxID=1093978 RepID=A0AAV4I7Y4_9GAST|nr:hypothetical protein ElyMa_004697100 [Elysia marginata]